MCDITYNVANCVFEATILENMCMWYNSKFKTEKDKWDGYEMRWKSKKFSYKFQ